MLAFYARKCNIDQGAIMIEIETARGMETVDITSNVERYVEERSIERGIEKGKTETVFNLLKLGIDEETVVKASGLTIVNIPLKTDSVTAQNRQ